MKQIIFHIETITPMFMSGADQGTFELRPPSIKGLLRFWWRAYYWGSQQQIALPDLQKREGEIFGTVADDGKKSSFSTRLSHRPTRGTRELSFAQKKEYNVKGVEINGKKRDINVLGYLAYGPYTWKDGKNLFIRDYLPPRTEFSLILSFSGNQPEQNIKQELFMSLYLLSVLGAVGSKAHNGFGNFYIKQVTDEMGKPCSVDLPLTFPTPSFFQEHIKNGGTSDNLPDFTALSRQMRIFELPLPLHNSWEDCLAALGKIYHSSKSQLHGSQKHYIGSPVNRCQERQAKPYFLKVIPVGKQFKGYMIYLPSQHCKTHGNEEEARKCLNKFNSSFIQQGMKEVALWQNP